MKNKIIDLTIERLSKKGNGLGSYVRENGPPLKIEVPFAIPADTVKANIIRKKRGAAIAKIEEVLIPSPSRIHPKCIHFGVCGGCRWQQLTYTDQLAIKQKTVLEYFHPLLTEKVIVHPIIPCSSPWQYRNKMEFSFSSDAAQNKYLGLIQDSSKGKVINLTECHLTNPWFIECLTAVRQWWQRSTLTAYRPNHDSGSLRTLILREGQRTGDRMVMLTVSGNPDFALNRTHLDSFVETVRNAVEPPSPDSHLTIFLRIQQIAKGMPTNFYEMHLYGPDHLREILHIQTEKEKPAVPMTFTVSPSAFFQPNTSQAEKLYSLAIQAANIPKNAIAYDLYCGTGTLGICIAQQAKQVIGIEISPESSLDARTNAKNNRIENYTVYTGPVHAILKDKDLPKADVVLVDPPRAGLDPEALKHIVNLGAEKIVYISCNPETQAQNIAELQRHGYHLQLLQPVDQFPQTVHIENIAVLIRKL